MIQQLRNCALLLDPQEIAACQKQCVGGDEHGSLWVTIVYLKSGKTIEINGDHLASVLEMK